MEGEKIDDLQTSIPAHCDLKTNKASTTIQREPNLKLQQRVANSTQANTKDICKIRPATPLTLKKLSTT